MPPTSQRTCLTGVMLLIFSRLSAGHRSVLGSQFILLEFLAVRLSIRRCRRIHARCPKQIRKIKAIREERLLIKSHSHIRLSQST